jgi:hypothetical protein
MEFARIRLYIINHKPEVREFLKSYAAELDLHVVCHGDLKYSLRNKTSVDDQALQETKKTYTVGQLNKDAEL